MLQSRYTNATLRRITEQIFAEGLEEAELAWEAMEAKKEANTQDKGKKCVPNKKAKLQGRVMELVA